MQMREIRQGLGLLGDLVSSWQAKAAAGDLERLARLFERHDDMSVAQFCSAVEKAMEEDDQPGVKKNPSRQRSADQGLVQECLGDLRACEQEQEAFEQALT